MDYFYKSIDTTRALYDDVLEYLKDIRNRLYAPYDKCVGCFMDYFSEYEDSEYKQRIAKAIVYTKYFFNDEEYNPRDEYIGLIVFTLDDLFKRMQVGKYKFSLVIDRNKIKEEYYKNDIKVKFIKNRALEIEEEYKSKRQKRIDAEREAKENYGVIFKLGNIRFY